MRWMGSRLKLVQGFPLIVTPVIVTKRLFVAGGVFTNQN